MQPNSQSSSALACGRLTAGRQNPPLTLYEIVSNVMEADRHRAQSVEAQRRLVEARGERKPEAPGLEIAFFGCGRKECGHE